MINFFDALVKSFVCFLRPICMLFFLAGVSSAQNEFDSVFRSELESIVVDAIDSVPAPGLAIAIVSKGKTVYANGFGYANVATREPVTKNTIFQIGSISKSFTATIAAQLVEESKLNWEDNAPEIISHAKFPHSKITLQTLANHTSGLPGDPPTLRRKHGDYPILAFTHFELYKSLEKSKLQFNIGTRWGYSNFGYAVLGHALEIKTGEPYEVLVNQQLFVPLGMESSTVTIWPELKDRLATPYHLENGKLKEYAMPWDEEALSPAGGISSTVSDLAKYMAYQITLSNTNSEIAKNHQSSIPSGDRHYGRGWFVEQMPGVGKVISVGGDVDGFVGEIVLLPESELGVVVLSNTGDLPPLPYLSRWLLARMHGDPNPQSKSEEAYLLGMINQSNRSWNNAVKKFEAVLAVEANHCRALYQLGRTAAISGKFLEKGKTALSQYLKLEPIPGIPYSAALWRLGMIEEHREDLSAAKRCYERALEIDPRFEPALNSLRLLNQQQTETSPNKIN